MKLRENYVFLVLVCLIFAFGMYGLVKTPQKTSTSENRTLSQFTHFTLKDFLSGKFQDDFENALSDQFAFSEKIRVTYGGVMNNLPTYGIKEIICKGRYVILDGEKYSDALFDCGNNMIAPTVKIGKSQQDMINKNIARYNHANSLVDTYYYLIEESNVFDFRTNERVIDFRDVLQNNLEGKYTFANLQYDTYDEYTNYFYKTDHHLNHNGQYQAYLDITKMLGIKNPTEPVATINHHESFFGSRARDTRDYSILDDFIFYKYDLPEHDIYVNREAKQYGHYDEYEKHDYTYKKSTNYYGWVFGSDAGEVIFDYHDSKKKNILVFSNSFDNPITPVIAQYFNKTYAVDLRHYKKHLKEDFVLSEYIKKNKIDKVLFIVSSRAILDNSSNQGLEK